MQNWAKFAVLAVTMLCSTLSLAAGDYVLEDKFRSELAKAEQGDSKAQYAIGEMYEKGRGTERDPRQAFSWYSKASQKGNMKAEYKLGMAYLSGKGIRKNSRKAHEWLKKSADKGYVRAQYHLGTLYEKGVGTEKDLDKALKWYQLALRGGYDAAAEGMQRIALQRKQQEEKLNRLRQEAVAKAKQLKKKPAPKAKPAATKKKPLTTKERILAGGWQKRDKGVEFLPSAVTRCQDFGSRMECQSRTLTRNIGMADIDYETKAVLFGFKDNGSFKVSYRNNVTGITVTDDEFANSGASVPVKLGWQDAEHKLVCHFEDDNHINCKKNKLRSIELHR